eukprot:3269154-Rhodomonas_salina.1
MCCVVLCCVGMCCVVLCCCCAALCWDVGVVSRSDVYVVKREREREREREKARAWSERVREKVMQLTMIKSIGTAHMMPAEGGVGFEDGECERETTQPAPTHRASSRHIEAWSGRFDKGTAEPSTAGCHSRKNGPKKIEKIGK